MNEQRFPGGVEWTRVVINGGLPFRGWSWNPVSGCLHACIWRAEDGTVGSCYAEVLAESGVAKSAYPHGFAHHYFHADRIDAPLLKRDPAGIFTVSMGDLFAWNVPAEQIELVLNTALT